MRITGLELPLQVPPGEDEDDPAVDSVVLEDTVGEHRAIVGPPADHAMQADVDAVLVLEGVAGVGPAGVRAGGALEASKVVAIAERVVA